jgi:hypothetical protein
LQDFKLNHEGVGVAVHSTSTSAFDV